MEGCDMYQRMKNKTEVMVGTLKLSKVLEKTWTYLIVDFIKKLPVVAEKNVILVICDRLSKITHFVATCQAQFTPGWKSTEYTRRWADL